MPLAFLEFQTGLSRHTIVRGTKRSTRNILCETFVPFDSCILLSLRAGRGGSISAPLP